MKLLIATKSMTARQPIGFRNPIKNIKREAQDVKWWCFERLNQMSVARPILLFRCHVDVVGNSFTLTVRLINNLDHHVTAKN